MIKNIIANFVGKFWSILSNFLFIPLYIHYLGFESYSIISFTLVIAGLMAVLDAGLTATLSREFARKDNLHEEKIRIFKTLESSYFIIIGICIFIVFTFSGIIAHRWLNLDSYNPERISFFIKIISFDIGFQLLLRFYMGGLLGLEKQITANLYQVGWGILRNGLAVIPIIFVSKLEIFFIWQTISTIIFSILLRLSLEKNLIGNYLFDIKPKIEKEVFKRIWKFAAGMLLISSVASLNTQMDKLTISKLLSIESLGYYTLAVSLAMGIIVIVNPISVALLPRFTTFYSDGKSEEASKLFHKVSLLVSILVFSIMANMGFFAKDLIWIWTGKMELAEHTYTLIPVIAFANAMLALQIIPYNIAIANGYTKLNNILGLISLFVTLPGYWIATKHFGAIGAAYVFCAVQTTMTLLYLYFINARFLKTKKISAIYLSEMLFPILISLIIAFAFSFIPERVLQTRIYTLVWIGFATAMTFSITIFILVPQSEIKRFVKIRSATKSF